jgi:DNA-binding NtrC family response regulator
MKKILLIEEDPKIEAGVAAALAEYEVEVVGGEQAADHLQKSRPDLIIFDIDLKAGDGLQLFRQVHLLAPQIKILVLSVSNNIPQAVALTKMGAADFLRKPLVAEQLKAAVRAGLAAEETVFGPAAGVGWLQGESPKLKKLYSDIQSALAASNNIVLFGEKGIEKKDLVKLIHAHSLKRKRKLQVLDLASFRRENMEAFFWGTVKELMAEPDLGAVQNEEDRTGTLYLENLESIDQSFKLSIFDFFRERKGKVDKEILALIGICEKSVIPLDNFVEIPPLRERKEDLPHLISHYLKLYSVKHNKKVKGVSADFLDFVAAYDYPGNFRELECLMEQAVLRAASETLDLADISLDFNGLVEVSIKKASRGGLEEFEKDLCGLLLAKTGGDVAAAARFLDMPRTVLNERIAELGCGPAD